MSTSRLKAFKRFALLKVSANRYFPMFSNHIVRLDAYLTREGNYHRSLVRLGGMTPVMLLVPGRKTGQIREVRLFAIDIGNGEFAVVGSNWGKPLHPAWTANLLETPEVSAVIRGQECRVAVRHVDGPQRQMLWEKLVDAWPNFDIYEQRSGRTLRVFLLTDVPLNGVKEGNSNSNLNTSECSETAAWNGDILT